MNKDTRKLRRAARRAGKPLREFARRQASVPLSDYEVAALRWLARKGLSRG